MFTVLPTGFGKSIIFQVVPNISLLLTVKGFAIPIVVVICPLVCLFESHIRKLNKRGISAGVFAFLLSSKVHLPWLRMAGMCTYVLGKDFLALKLLVAFLMRCLFLKPVFKKLLFSYWNSTTSLLLLHYCSSKQNNNSSILIFSVFALLFILVYENTFLPPVTFLFVPDTVWPARTTSVREELEPENCVWKQYCFNPLNNN